MSDPGEQALVHACYVEAFRVLAAAGGGSVLEGESSVLVACGVPMTGMNVGFWPPGAPGAEVAAAVEHFDALGVPFCLRFGGGAGPEAARALADAGLVPAMELPAMLAGASAPGAGVPQEPGLEIVPVRIDDDEAGFLAVNAAAFEIPPEFVGQIFGRHILSPTVEQFVGKLDGRVLATSCAVLHRRAVGIYNVATSAEHRGRGFGAALTKAAVAWGRERGRRLATLQSSPMGFRVYRRLGFRTIVSYASYSRPKS